MKKIYYLILLITSIFLNACSDSIVEEIYYPSLTNQLLTVNPKEITFSEFGESKTLTISTLKTPWKFVDYPEWITITPNSGDASSTVTVTASQNTSADVTRTCVFYLQSTDPNWEYKAYVSATQKNANAFITPSPSSLSFDAGASTKSVSITSNVKWEVNCNETWISVLQTKEGFDVSVEENTTGAVRNAIIQINGGSISSTLNVSQQANGVSCSVNSLEFYQKGGTQNFTISSQTSWSTKVSNDWINVSPATGVSGQNNISVAVDVNPASSERRGYVYIQVGNTNIAQISIVQKGTYLTTDPTSLSFNPQSESKSVCVSSNLEWNVSSSESWINLSDEKGNGDCVITVSVEDNSSDIQRSGIVSINSIDGSISRNINVVQSGVSISTDVTQIHFPYNGGKQNLKLDVNTAWTISSSDSWLSFSSKSGDYGVKNISVNASENSEENDRATSFYINASGYNKEVKVLQDGKYFYINNEALNVRATANSISLDVKTSEDWTTISNVSWLTVSPSSGTGDATVNISVAENNSTDSRQGKVTFKPADGRQIVVNITQSGKTITTSPSSVNLDYTGTTQKVYVTADGKFSATTTTSWIKISNVTSSSFDVSATDANETNESRYGVITLSLEGTSISKTLQVTQSKMPEEANYVDLGLPSGTKWCKMNYGAKTEDQLGTECVWSQSVGSVGRKPTRDEVNELVNYCTWTCESNENWDGWSTGVATILYTIKGPNGKSIVLPVRPWVGYAKDCSYWINEMYNTTDAYYFYHHGGLTFKISYKGVNYTQNNYIRPVLK